jgi:hypothetical protein
MKCTACGYQKGWDWVGDDYYIETYEEVNPGGKDFIKLMSAQSVQSDDRIKGWLYACPSCGTVRFEEEAW